MDLVDETGVYENPAAAIGTMFAEAALEHARADAEYFDEDFRMRATEGIDMWTAAREIAKSVPEAKPATFNTDVHARRKSWCSSGVNRGAAAA